MRFQIINLTNNKYKNILDLIINATTKELVKYHEAMPKKQWIDRAMIYGELKLRKYFTQEELF